MLRVSCSVSTTDRGADLVPYFPAEQRSRRWAESNREILRRLHSELELAAYLPRSLGTEPLDDPRRRRALLQRACAMARLGLWDEALIDLGRALVDTMRGVPLGTAEQDLCRRSLGKFIRFDFAIEGLVDDPPRAGRFKRLLEDAGNADAGRLFAAELSRYAWTKVRQYEPARAARALTLARQIAGIRSWLPRD